MLYIHFLYLFLIYLISVSHFFFFVGHGHAGTIFRWGIIASCISYWSM